MNKGYIFYVIGSSGVGKDSILNKVKKKLTFENKFIFPKRFITRPNIDENEKHIALSKDDFNHRIDQNLFSLFWEAHEYFYGIGIEIEYWNHCGFHVIINGSRAYHNIAKLKYKNLKSILIDADKSIIYKRLVVRDRESTELINKRMQRNEQFGNMQFDFIIKNEFDLNDAVNSFLNYINQLPTIK